MEPVVLSLLLLSNVVGFALVGLDKWRARRDRWRISELALVTPAVLGGWPGILAAMKTFRHKTRKRTFQLKLALAILSSFGVAYLWLQMP
jgi:uncharacterized membrane protein YsdA (DUF1294 family)